MLQKSSIFLFAFALLLVMPTFAHANNTSSQSSFTEAEVLSKAEGLMGSSAAGLAKAIEKAFSDFGAPNAFIEGEEFGGAMMVGLRYGEGTLNLRNGQTRKIFWQGPSIGWDVGGHASKVITLVYNLKNSEDIFRRFPGVDGSFYFFAGASLNYQSAGDVILAPIRTGVGMRWGANIGYLHYNKEHSWFPF